MKSNILLIFLLVISVSSAQQINKDSVIAIARDAFVYGYPIIENYRVMYQSTQDKTFAQYAPFNTFYHANNVATPEDTLFVSPNVDTPYSSAVIDVSCEPIVFTYPSTEDQRFIGVPFYDLYTHVIYTISPLNNGNNGGSFIIANEKWNGEVPKSIKKVIRSETDLVYTLIRTQLYNRDDLPNVHKLQSQYKLQTLSEYLGKEKVNCPEKKLLDPINPQSPTSEPDVHFFNVLNFALTFCNPHPSETELLKRFAEIGIIAGKEFKLTESIKEEYLIEGIKEAQKSFITYLPNIKSSSEIFGSREYLKNNYLGRAIGAWTGIYANEADVFLGIQGFDRQSDGKPFSGANKYTATFEKDNFPPVSAFWSITMYSLPKRFLYANKIERYAINSSMVEQLKKNSDGSVTIYIQHESPGKELESNWLPSPEDLFTMAFRCYLPQEKLRNGKWQPPEVIKTK